MNFLSSNNIKHPSEQSQNLSSPQSIRLPLSNSPANQKINMINKNTIIHEFVRRLIFRNFYFRSRKHFRLKFPKSELDSVKAKTNRSLTEGFFFLAA